MRRKLNLIVASLCGLLSGTSVAENSIALFIGKAFSTPGDVRFKSNNGDNLLFQNVSWSDESFKPPLYYGIRLSHWSEKVSSYGISVDFTHAKIYANMAQRLRVTGQRAGQSVDTTEALGQTFKRLALSHGYNYLTLNGMVRPKAVDQTIQPYLGIGAGFAVPHVEIQTANEKVDNYQLTGSVLQGLIGMRVKGTPVIAEYKYSYGLLHSQLPSGSDVRFNTSTHHFTGGFIY